MNSKNSKVLNSHRLLLDILDRINLKTSDKCVALSNLSIYYTWKNVKKSYHSNKFKTSARTWNKKLELPDASYSISNIQDYFRYFIKKYETVTDNPAIRIYVNKIKNRVTIKTEAGYYL